MYTVSMLMHPGSTDRREPVPHWGTDWREDCEGHSAVKAGAEVKGFLRGRWGSIRARSGFVVGSLSTGMRILRNGRSVKECGSVEGNLEKLVFSLR